MTVYLFKVFEDSLIRVLKWGEYARGSYEGQEILVGSARNICGQ